MNQEFIPNPNQIPQNSIPQIQPKPPKPSKFISILNLFLNFIKNIAILILFVLLIRHFVLQPFVVDGSSMEPTLHNNDYLLIEKVSARFHNYSRGDIVVFKYPKNTKLNFIKRIIGLPGETIQIDQNGILIFNQANPRGFYLNENYLPSNIEYSESQTITLQDDEYYVFGDNRNNSSDSREWGPLNKNYIIGNTWFIIYPFSDFSKIPLPSY